MHEKGTASLHPAQRSLAANRFGDKPQAQGVMVSQQLLHSSLQ